MKFASIVTALALLLGRAAPAEALEFDAVMVGGRPNGDPASPGLGAGIDWSVPQFGVMNSAGQVGLQAQLLPQGGVTSANDVGVWRWESGSLTLVAREGSQAPGLPAGATIGTLGGAIEINIDDAGAILFRPNLSGTATSSNNLAWTTVATNGTPTLVAREGNPAPGIAPAIYGSSLSVRDDGPGLTAGGSVLYDTTLAGPGVTSDNDRALWFGVPGSAALQMREGQSSPAFGPAATLGDFSGADTFAADGRIAVVAGVANGNTTLALLAGAPGALAPIAQQGQAAPGTAASFLSLSRPKINSAGDVVFNADLAVSRALYVNSAGGLQLLANDGLSAPGAGEVFSAPETGFGTRYSYSINATSDVAFLAELALSVSVDASNNRGLWIHDDGVTRLAVREGDPAPGLLGVAFGNILNFTFNDREDLVFTTALVGNVTAGVDDTAIWLASADGSITKILRSGDLFDVDPSAAADVRTISSLRLGGVPGSNEGLANEQALSDAGQLLLNLNFVDGSSGLFVTQIPEPATWSLATLAVISLSCARRRA